MVRKEVGDTDWERLLLLLPLSAPPGVCVSMLRVLLLLCARGGGARWPSGISCGISCSSFSPVSLIMISISWFSPSTLFRNREPEDLVMGPAGMSVLFGAGAWLWLIAAWLPWNGDCLSLSRWWRLLCLLLCSCWRNFAISLSCSVLPQDDERLWDPFFFSAYSSAHALSVCVALSLMQGVACPRLSRGQCPARYGAARVSREEVRRIMLEGLEEGGRVLSPRYKAKVLILKMFKRKSRN